MIPPTPMEAAATAILDAFDPLCFQGNPPEKCQFVNGCGCAARAAPAAVTAYLAALPVEDVARVWREEEARWWLRCYDTPTWDEGFAAWRGQTLMESYGASRVDATPKFQALRDAACARAVVAMVGGGVDG